MNNQRAPVGSMGDTTENKLRKALAEYANVLNWATDEQGIRRVWLEPGSSSPEAYNGFEMARAALSTPAGQQASPVAEVCSKFGDPEAFGERELVALVDIQKLPYGTKLYAVPPTQGVPK